MNKNRKQWEGYHGIKIPDGWQIHHWLPRSCGGDDRMTNTVACPVKAHHRFHRDRGDRVGLNFIFVANHTGRKHTEETRALMRKSKSKAHCDNISKGKMGYTPSDEHKKNMSMAAKKRPSNRKGCRLSIQYKMLRRLRDAKTVMEVISE